MRIRLEHPLVITLVLCIGILCLLIIVSWSVELKRGKRRSVAGGVQKSVDLRDLIRFALPAVVTACAAVHSVYGYAIGISTVGQSTLVFHYLWPKSDLSFDVSREVNLEPRRRRFGICIHGEDRHGRSGTAILDSDEEIKQFAAYCPLMSNRVSRIQAGRR